MVNLETLASQKVAEGKVSPWTRYFYCHLDILVQRISLADCSLQQKTVIFLAKAFDEVIANFYALNNQRGDILFLKCKIYFWTTTFMVSRWKWRKWWNCTILP